MTYQQTIDHLYAHLPMFSKIGAAAYKEDLHNTIALCKGLDDPHKKFKSVHIAGTNGKGSTSHMLAAILQQAGYKTGLYTSPHLKDFRERIKINGEMIAEDFVINFVERMQVLSDEIQPSFFELTVAMAFDYFSSQQVDIAMIETGLGGRLDSTNVITPLLSIITNIGYDHMNILGDTLEKIAFEKAGIIKPMAPIIIGEYIQETKPVFINKAVASNAPIQFAQEEYEVENIRSTIHELTCEVKTIKDKSTATYTLDLPAFYQVNNLRAVLCACEVLKTQGFIIGEEDKKQALQSVKKLTGLHGRWEVLAENPTIILDVAHNVDGMKQVLREVNTNENTPHNKIHFILGMVKDKEADKVLALLPKNANYYFTNAHIPRALPAAELQKKANEFGLTGRCISDVNEAIGIAKQQAREDDLIIVCGSVFLVGEVDVEQL
ncbi:MAG: folylpolyglutamate synthase/dihydrofolate synthase family protein [Ferruginibacter sp.]